MGEACEHEPISICIPHRRDLNVVNAHSKAAHCSLRQLVRWAVTTRLIQAPREGLLVVQPHKLDCPRIERSSRLIGITAVVIHECPQGPHSDVQSLPHTPAQFHPKRSDHPVPYFSHLPHHLMPKEPRLH